MALDDYRTAPRCTARLVGIATQLLPKAGGVQKNPKRGSQSFSWWSPSLLTALTERAAIRNNELP